MSKKPTSKHADHVDQMIGPFGELNNIIDTLRIPPNSTTSELVFNFIFFLKRFYLFIFKEMGREGETEGEKHRPVASHMPPTSDPARNPGMCPDWESNRDLTVHWPALSSLRHTSQGIILFSKDNNKQHV